MIPDLLRVLVWGLFVTCSWTWCIGMFLPKIMVDRYGGLGFLVFAIPNVIGTVAFGAVVRRPETSRALVRDHGGMMLVFSMVVLAFHAFFLPFVLINWGGVESVELAVVIGAAVIAVGAITSILLDGLWWILTLLVAGVTAAAMITAHAPPGGFPFATTEPTLGAGALIGLAPIVAAGFLLCPYLDPTFHRALQGAGGPHGFLGFGVLFPVVITFTLIVWYQPSGTVGGWMLAHILTQACFTTGMHARELWRNDVIRCPRKRTTMIAAPLIVAGLYPVLMAITDDAPAAGINTYLRFLVWYGLIFPAYILVFMGRGGRGRPTWRTLLLPCVFMLVMGPFYELGFIEGVSWWLLVPTAVCVWVVARRVVRARVA